MAQKTISVLGCGWLGLPLAQALVEAGYRVKGSTTTPEKVEVLQQSGIEPFLLSFPENSPKTDLATFLEADVLVFNLPPKRTETGAQTYEETLAQVLVNLPTKTTNILFISSTSVYPDLHREVTEQDAIASSDSPSLLLRCEYQVQQAVGVHATIVRFGGLMGGKRHPGRFLAGRKDVPQPLAPVNMIHLQDCVGVLQGILQEEAWGETFNACAPSHPSRQEFYTAAAQQLGLVPPHFLAEKTTSFKIINSQALMERLSYSFVYPDLMACLADSGF
ncbi:SDR family NAD(P)-dependent oxidoreductase [Nibribacter ruber]|uniref:SDR family NAD(P)-dependent oxidoreductase n=1 Tax=Nibribacter ruber TaxID=2698458 RepID=A0A6P1NRD1_9BACT|nr:SDR family oxidoreductase [Nibribacter ruber]QHL86237.1 SDR family NAD(P)-dependent oxidoreductase [Nibribacter ruber]